MEKKGVNYKFWSTEFIREYLLYIHETVKWKKRIHIIVSDTDENAEERGISVFKNRTYTKSQTRPEDHMTDEKESVLDDKPGMSKNVMTGVLNAFLSSL